MQQNKYDDPAFFAQYDAIARSVGGLVTAYLADRSSSETEMKQILQWLVANYDRDAAGIERGGGPK